MWDARRRYLVLIPSFAAFIWFSTLLAMLLTWLISGCPKYVSTQATVVYISDVGASFLKPLFIVACCITGPSLFLSLVIERLLRHQGRLPPDLYAYERAFGRLAMIGAFIAMLGLALLSGFDVKRHPTEHAIFLLVFMLGVSLSAMFTVVEFRWLARDYPEIDRLRKAYVAKAAIGSTLVVLAVAFGVMLFDAPNVGGVIEWLIAFGFSFYLLTFVYDLQATSVKASESRMEELVVKPS